MAELELAGRLDPGDPRPLYLAGKALWRLGRPAEAAQELQHALQRDPNDLPTLVAFARLLASHPDGHIRNGTQAVILAERAAALTGGEQASVLDTLAMAYAEAGRFPEAQAAENKGIERAGGTGDTNSLAELRQRAELFRAGQPYRQPAEPGR